MHAEFVYTKKSPRIGNCGHIFLMTVLAILLNISYSARNRERHNASKGCEFPPRWAGIWFQKGVHQEIKIEKDIFSFKGKCVSSDGPMFFIENTKDRCFRCVVIYEKHINVLQYRETFCYFYKSLREACATLNADAALYSLFRVNAEPVPCPLHGPFTFSYSRGGTAVCRHPVSTVDTCTQEHRLLFRFQACADVLSSESSVEELTCLALWKEGSARYLVGKVAMMHHHNHDNAYRCFMFEFLPEKNEVHMSQTADATCDGLVSPWEGSRTMTLEKQKLPTSSCQFPSWATSPHRWESLDGRNSYVFSVKNTSFKRTALQKGHRQTEAKFICIAEVEEHVNSTIYITHGTSGCESGYVCIKLHKRNKSVMEMQMGSFKRSPQEACHQSFSGHESEEMITLVASSSPYYICPMLSETNGLKVSPGKLDSFNIEVCDDSAPRISGCQSEDTMQFSIECSSYTDYKDFRCHGNWEEDGRNFVVTSLRRVNVKYCFVYRNTGAVTQVSGIRNTCQRSIEPGVTGDFTFEVSSNGECYTLNICSIRRPSTWTYIMCSCVTFFLLLSRYQQK